MGMRNGERIGWLGGWLGSFLWVPALGILFLVRGQPIVGALGIALGMVGMGAAYLARPWRHPDTPYWKLMMAPMAVLAIAVVWTLWAFGPEARHAEGPGGWALLPAVGVFIVPFFSVGRRRWRDGEPQPPPSGPGENSTGATGSSPRV
jgi:hypothetical protein